MPYVDLNTIHNPATGTVAPAAWGDQVRDNLEFLINPPTCSVFNVGAQVIPNVTTTALNAGSETFDNDSMHSTVTNTSRITVQTTGRYLLYATTRFAANVAGTYRQIVFRVNGTTSYAMNTVSPVNDASVETIVSASKALPLVAGDYVEVMVRHNVGGNLSVIVDEFAAIFLTR